MTQYASVSQVRTRKELLKENSGRKDQLTDVKADTPTCMTEGCWIRDISSVQQILRKCCSEFHQQSSRKVETARNIPTHESRGAPMTDLIN